jgi:hypothetical protein
VFSENENTFVKGSGSWKLPNQLGTISQYEDRLWLTYGKPRKLAYIDKKYGDLHKIDRLNRFQVRHIETRPNGDLWMAADLSLIHYQAHTSSPSNIKPDISFRKFSINNKTQWGLNKDVSDTSNAPMIFDYQHNSAQFEFSSSGLDVDFKDTYRTKITGLGEEGWTDWSRKTHVEFIDLSPGKYVFNIQSKDFKGQKSITKPFEFEILPPWWETIWFYTLQFSFLVSLMILSMFLNRTGRISRFSKILSYTVLIAVFETIMMILDPYKGMLGFGVPAIQLGFNVAFAITLEPAQALFQKIVNDTKAIN